MSRTTNFRRFGFCVAVCLCFFVLGSPCFADWLWGPYECGNNTSSCALGTISGGSITINSGGTFTGGDSYSFFGGLSAISLSPGGTFSSGDRITGNTALSGDVILNAGAIMAPGNSIGTISVTGDYTLNANATLEIEINNAGASDLVDVSGKATINGGTVHVLPENTLYTDRIYTFLTAVGGVTGEFDSVVMDKALLGDPLFWDTSLIYNPTSIQLRVYRNYAASAQTSNQRAIGNYLNDYGPPTSIFYRLNQITTPQEARTALDSLSGEIYGSLSTVGIENTGQFLQILASRLRSRSLGQRFFYAAPISEKVEKEEGTVIIRGQEGFGWSIQGLPLQNASRPTPWAEGYGIAAQIASDGNASGLDYSTGGTIFGLEQNFDQNTLFGIVGGYCQTAVQLDSLDDWSEINSGQVGLYLQRDNGINYMTGIAAYGYNAYEVRRHILPQSDDYQSRKAYKGNEFSFYLETGRNYYFPIAYLQPFAALQYIQLHQNQIHENDAESASLWIGGIHADSFRGLLGLRAVRDVPFSDGRLLSLEGRALWRHEFLDEVRLVDARFAEYPGSSFTIQGLNIDRDAAILGGGLTFCLRTGSELYVNYDILVSENYTAHAGTGGLMLAW